MILTGSEIAACVQRREITIEPFSDDMLNPNSYNYRLGVQLYRLQTSADGCRARRILCPLVEGRWLLKKQQLYLGHTLEVIGSTTYVTSLIGRSSMGRLGIFVQVSANIGHVGAIHRWTLEIVTAHDTYLYPGQRIGQISFWTVDGPQQQYEGWYGRHNEPMLSKRHADLCLPTDSEPQPQEVT
jgi:dCTP deaminase